MTVPCAWDLGVRWFSRRVTAPTDLPLSLPFVRDQVVRVANDGADDAFLEAALWSVTQTAEDDTQRALMPQTWQMVLDRFPSRHIVIERPPLIAIVGLGYYDGDNALQDLAVSPAEFEVTPSGAYAKAQLRPLAGASFPSTYCRPDAVTLTYTCGYEDTSDPVLQQINTGIALMVGELYKLRSLSVQANFNTPAVLQASRFWRRVW